MSGAPTGRDNSDVDSLMSLDPEVWKHLPPELLGLLLSKISFSDFMALRCVSKQWNLNITSRVLEGPQNQSPKCMLANFEGLSIIEGVLEKNSVKVYDSSSQAWQKLYLGFLDDINDVSAMYLVGSGDGLLVFCGLTANKNDHFGSLGYEQLIVCNPVTKAHERVEMPQTIAPFCLGVMCHLDYYQLILVGNKDYFSEGSVNRPNIYNSATKSWTKGTPVPNGDAHISGAVICKESFYCLNLCNVELGFEVWKYDVENDSWSIIYPSPSLANSRTGIARRQGRLLLLTGSQNSDFYIHELIEENGCHEWNMLKKIPSDVIRILLTHTGDVFQDYWRFFGEGHLIYMIGYAKNGVHRGKDLVVLEQDLNRDTLRLLEPLSGKNLFPGDVQILRPSLQIL